MERVTDYLAKHEIRALTRASNVRGALEVAVSWGLVALALAACAAWPHPLVVLAAVVLIGGRQLGLAVLMHECAHRSLFRSRRANDLVGGWLCGGPVWSDLGRYRAHHLRHHTLTGTADDPDLGLVTPFPVTRGALFRKALRDLTGLAALRRVAALLLMDLGLLSYTASTGARWLGRDGRRPARLVADAARNLAPVVLTNLALAALLTALGAGWLYLVWVAAYVTTFSLFLRLRAIAEHASTELGPNPWRNTRTTRANPLARLLVAPHGVNYHLEHHLLMTVPCYRLAAMHQQLAAGGALAHAVPVASGYVEVLRQVTR